MSLQIQREKNYEQEVTRYTEESENSTITHIPF